MIWCLGGAFIMENNNNTLSVIFRHFPSFSVIFYVFIHFHSFPVIFKNKMDENECLSCGWVGF